MFIVYNQGPIFLKVCWVFCQSNILDLIFFSVCSVQVWMSIPFKEIKFHSNPVLFLSSKLLSSILVFNWCSCIPCPRISREFPPIIIISLVYLHLCLYTLPFSACCWRMSLCSVNAVDRSTSINSFNATFHYCSVVACISDCLSLFLLLSGKQVIYILLCHLG